MAGLRNRSISDFKSQLIGGGARPNLFQVAIPSFPSTIAGLWKSGAGQEQEDFNFFAKATALPAQNIAAIDVPLIFLLIYIIFCLVACFFKNIFYSGSWQLTRVRTLVFE